MSTLQFLFELIHRLSKGEKRFFKLFSSLYNSKKTKHYLLLYDVLVKEKEFDKAVISKKISKKIPNNIIPKIKQTLVNQLLDSLLLYNKEHLAYFKEVAELSKVDLLIEKRLCGEAQKMLSKQKNRLISKAHFDLSSRIQKRELALSQNLQHNTLSFHQTLQKSYDDLLEDIDKAKEIAEAKKLHTLVTMHSEGQYLQDEKQLAQIQQILEQGKNILASGKLKTIQAKADYLNIVTMCYTVLKDSSPDYIGYLDELYIVLKDNPKIFDIHNLFIPLVKKANLFIENDAHEAFHQHLAVMEAFIPTLKPKRQIEPRYYTYLRILSYHIKYKKKLNPQRIQAMEQFIYHTPDVVREQQMDVAANLAEYFFTFGAYGQSQSILHQVIMNHALHETDFNYVNIRIMYALCFYEEKIPQIASRELLSFRRKLRRNDNTLTVLDELLRLLHFITNTHPENKHKIAFALQNVITLLRTKQNHSIAVKLYFVQEWAKQKLAALKIRQAV